MTDYDAIHQSWLRAHAAGSPVRFVRQRVVLQELARLTPGNTLDAGCGTGDYSVFLAGHGHTVRAFDPSPIAVAALKERHGQMSGICAEVGTIEGFCSMEDFDNIVSIEVIEHLKDDRKAIHKLCSLLRGGGTMVVSAPASPMLYSEVDRVSGHQRRYAYSGFRALFTEAGFSEVSIRCYGFPVLFLYALTRKYFLDKSLIRRFSRPDPGSQRAVRGLASLFPLIFCLDRFKIPALSVGYVARCTK